MVSPSTQVLGFRVYGFGFGVWDQNAKTPSKFPVPDVRNLCDVLSVGCCCKLLA